MDQAVQVYSGTAARASAVPSPSTGMVAYATATGLQVFNGSAWVNVGGATYAAISGGASTASATVDGTAFTIHTFTATGTLTVTTAGLVDVLFVAGGGGGSGARTNATACGGGGGGVMQTTVYLTANQTITIGAGGSAGTTATTAGGIGSPSSFGTANRSLGVIGGGGGGGFDQPGLPAASAGGDYNTRFRVNASNGLYGKDGGSVVDQFSGAGGGGGATAVGANGSGTTGGAGGAGYDVSAFIGGSALFKSGGGGGGGATGGAGGSSVGGAGGSNAAGASASANTGGGGGGGAPNTTNAGGAGGSGIVFVRVKTS